MTEQDSVSSLSVTAKELTEEVHKLRGSVDNLGPRVRRAEWISLICVVVVLIAMVGFQLIRQNDTNRRIDGLCPLFALIIGGADPSSRPEGPARDQYTETIRVITQAYGQLGCIDPLVPPRTEN